MAREATKFVLLSAVLTALVGCSNDPPSKDTPSKPVTVEDVIKGLGLDLEKVDYSDEPPGKLRELSWSKVKLPGTTAEVNVTIEIVYTLDVFSIERKWDAKRVRAAKVIKVTLTPPKP